MRVENNNLYGMLQAELQLEQSAQNISKVSNTIGDPQTQEITQHLLNSIVEQIPQTIAYQANVKGVETQNEVSDMLLNIKA